MKNLLKLHVGCGKRFIPGFVHVDQVSFPHVDYVQDIRRLENFKDGAAGLIYACQVIEYFDREEVIGVLKEWIRVLAPGGILRLSVPNFQIITRLYSAGMPLEWFLGTLYGKISDGNVGHVYHKTTYDESSLTAVLSSVGLTHVGHWNWRDTEHANIDDYSQAYFPHMEKEKGLLFNLNMEGTLV